MILRITILSFLVVTLKASSCGALSGGNQECVSHMMITVDGSGSMPDPNSVLQILNFLNSTLMTKWAYSAKKTQFSYSLYGLVERTNLTCKGYNTAGQSDPELVCTALSQLRDSYNRGVNAPITLFDITTDIYNCTIKEEVRVYDLVIIFTANSNLGDIQNSAWFAAEQPTIVVNLGTGDFSSWVAKSARTTILCNGMTLNDDLANRILSAQCSGINGMDQCNVVDNSTTVRPSQVTALPTVPDDQASLCDCDITKSWNDIMILADASSAMGLDRFHELQAFVQSALSQATMGANNYQTQVGVITYNTGATMVANLDKYKNIDDFLFDDWGKTGSADTNILGAVDLAIDTLESPKHRPKSRKVMIIGASTYREGNYEFPQNQTLTFKRNFGVIIVIGYGDIHGMGTEVLKQMASDGFYIDATPGQFPDFKQLTKMICDANCFCPGQQQDGYFPVVRDGESWPSQGCYWDSTLTAIQPLVNRTCSTLVSAAGVTAMPNTIIKQRSLIGGAAQNLTKPAFFIGLQRVANVWKWDDGTAYEGGDIYGAGDCSTLRQGSGFNTNITAVDCHEGYYYACQTKPCTSSYYCE
ncbi:unnamed protein product, partial [Mesorhabditis belari]|uniref:VWFA domain-containing protein n=1 Tax=Mesorhabditis belari TaxID=2138241 RepID=A0AAF3EN12_9BILA